MTLRVRWASRGGLFVELDESGLDTFVEVLRAGGSCALDSVSDPTPYSGTLGEMAVDRLSTEDLVDVSFTQEQIKVRGGGRYIDFLAGFLETLRPALRPGPRTHTHIDPYPGHAFLAPTSQGLIIGKPIPLRTIEQ